MQIEAGKFYRTRDGNKVGPTKARAVLLGRYGWEIDGVGVYDDQGRDCDDDDCVCRLVAEWVESPVRTVTRKEIVPGVYGPIQITKVYADGVNICANPGKWSADDFRAAAATFIELADALREAGEQQMERV